MVRAFAGEHERAARPPRRSAVDAPRTAQDSTVILRRAIGNRAVTGLLQSGAPLRAPMRRPLESRLGQDLSAVRVHDGPAAAEAARMVDALAFTVGDHIVLGAGAPGRHTRPGLRLLAHELTHVVQQRRGGAPPNAARASAEKEAEAVSSALVRGRTPPPVSQGTAVEIACQRRLTEETGLAAEVDPAPVVRGSVLPVPARITLLKRPAYGRGGWLTAPAFLLRLDPRVLVAGLLDQVTVRGVLLTNPTLVYSARTNSFTAAGTLSIPTDYPGWDTPTDIGVRISSTALGEFTVVGSVGPLVAELTLTVSYDTAALRRIARAAAAGDLGALAAGLGELDRPARFGFSGGAGLGWPGHGLPLAYARGFGSADPYRATVYGGVAGMIGLPKGTYHPELAVPAAGLALGGASIRRRGGYTAGYGFAGATSTVSIGDLATGNLGAAFSPFAYAEVTLIRHTANGHEFGLKLSAQHPLGAAAPEGTAVEQLRRGLYSERTAVRYPTTPKDAPKRDEIDPAVLSHQEQLRKGPEKGTGVGLEVTGTFDLFGSK